MKDGNRFEISMAQVALCAARFEISETCLCLTDVPSSFIPHPSSFPLTPGPSYNSFQMAAAFEKVSEYLRAEIARGTFPGAQYVIGESGDIIAEDAIGWAVVDPLRIAANHDTIYDLASLTKPLVTSLLAVIFAERRQMDLNAPVSAYLSEFSGQPDKSRITVTDLLTHASGMPRWSPLYLEADSVQDVPAVIARMPLEEAGPQGAAQIIYSDLNYILLGYIIERVSGERFDRVARREIIEPLGLRRTMFNPPPELKRETAATEWGQAYEGGEAYEAALRHQVLPTQSSGSDPKPKRPVWRTDLIWGEVHDGNAYFLGGASGHAGLFSTAREVFQISNQFLSSSRLLGRESLKLFTKNFTEGRGDSRAIGWLLASTKDCSAGPLLPTSAFGHTGFTGTSVWIDPERQRVFILLTNRVHPEVGPIDMKAPRQQFNRLAVEELDRLSIFL
jgi:serine-type D-Ala-D-Ala carboxypeptidase